MGERDKPPERADGAAGIAADGSDSDTVDAYLQRVAPPPPAQPLRLVQALPPTLPSPGAEAVENADATQLPTVPREHYVAITEYGRGGMGRVIMARDRRLGRRVAVKELLHRDGNEGRFVREALITAR